MKKSVLIPSFLGFAMLVFTGNVFTNSGGVTSSLSGSPLSGGNTCTNCHSGGSITTQTVDITTNIPASGYEENTDYTVKVKAKGNGATAVKGGFNATIETTGAHAGTFSTLSGGGAQTTQHAATHIPSNNTFVNDSLVWEFTWNSGTASAATLYAAINFTNGNGSTSGDAVLTQTLNLTKASIGIAENNLAEVGVFPNPASEFISVSASLKKESNVIVTLYDLQGREVAELLNNYYSAGLLQEKLALPSLASGSYLLNIGNGATVQTERVYIQQ